jgi:hypothetical protein
MNCSTTPWIIEDFQSDANYFSRSYESSLIKLTAVTLSITSTIVILPFWLGIIWNEQHGSDMNRVITNRLICSMAWTCIAYIVFVQSFDIVRHVYGPLPETVCSFSHVMKNALIQQLEMVLILILVFRYIFIFWLKNPMAFQDEFWAIFINIWLLMFCVISQWIILYLPTIKPTLFYYCSGKNPPEDSVPFSPKRNLLRRAFEIVSIIFIFAMYIRIKKFKWKKLKLTTWLENQKSLYLKDIEHKFIASSLIYMLTILNTTIGTAFVVKINSLTPFELNFYPNNLYVIFLQLIFPMLTMGGGVFAYYIEHKMLIYILLSDLKENIGT